MNPIVIAVILYLLLSGKSKAAPAAPVTTPPVGNMGPMADTGTGDNSLPEDLASGSFYGFGDTPGVF